MVLRFCMASRFAFLLLLVTLAHVAESWAWDSAAQWGLAHLGSSPSDNVIFAPKTCNGNVGECMDDGEETMMESEISRRGLMAAGKRYISYGALKKNQVPCNRRGQSYYNCQRSGKVRPYKRSCTVITRCARDLS